jgi:uncharacterized protein
MNLILAMVALSLAALAGCGRDNSESATPAVLPMPTKAQPRLQTIRLWLGPAEINAELALTPQQTQTGMMFRKEMKEDEGMLFVFPFPHQASFWMKNTFVPLSAAYIDPAGMILEIRDFEPQNTNPVVAASANVQYVLETPQGWFKRNNVRTGMLVRTEHGPLARSFTFGR